MYMNISIVSRIYSYVRFLFEYYIFKIFRHWSLIIIIIYLVIFIILFLLGYINFKFILISLFFLFSITRIYTFHFTTVIYNFLIQIDLLIWYKKVFFLDKKLTHDLYHHFDTIIIKKNWKNEHIEQYFM